MQRFGRCIEFRRLAELHTKDLGASASSDDMVKGRGIITPTVWRQSGGVVPLHNQAPAYNSPRTIKEPPHTATYPTIDALSLKNILQRSAMRGVLRVYINQDRSDKSFLPCVKFLLSLLSFAPPASALRTPQPRVPCRRKKFKKVPARA